MDRQCDRKAASSPEDRYVMILVRGHLDPHWSEWLEAMAITHDGDYSRIEGSLRDQGALHGLLNKLRDLRLTLVMVLRLEGAAHAAPSTQVAPGTGA